MMKRFIALLLAALTLLVPIATSEEEYATWEDETHPFVFLEGDYAYLLESVERFTTNPPVIYHEKIAAAVAGAIVSIDMIYPDGVLTTVYHDEETDMWIVVFDKWPLTAGGRVSIALAGEDARVLGIWPN